MPDPTTPSPSKASTTGSDTTGPSTIHPAIKGLNPLRLIGAVLLSLLLGLIVYASLVREAQPGDTFYMLVRWPLGFLALVLVPLLGIRLALRAAGRRTGRAGMASPEAVSPPPE